MNTRPTDRGTVGGKQRQDGLGTAWQSIFDFTRSLLAEHGYDRLTIDEIVSAARVGKQTIYRWRLSKSAIVTECVGAGPDIMRVNSREA